MLSYNYLEYNILLYKDFFFSLRFITFLCTMCISRVDIKPKVSYSENFNCIYIKKKCFFYFITKTENIATVKT